MEIFLVHRRIQGGLSSRLGAHGAAAVRSFLASSAGARRQGAIKVHVAGRASGAREQGEGSGEGESAKEAAREASAMLVPPLARMAAGHAAGRAGRAGQWGLSRVLARSVFPHDAGSAHQPCWPRSSGAAAGAAGSGGAGWLSQVGAATSPQRHPPGSRRPSAAGIAGALGGKCGRRGHGKTGPNAGPRSAPPRTNCGGAPRVSRLSAPQPPLPRTAGCGEECGPTA